ncbi:GNAT family N-acetyltransferase [Aerococcus viridans]|uniref:GNAT family N-acetyltransferase n=1 Tax=Aerococcus viridans TaxID=1377 RepID=UPI002DB5723D|nr:GNAT family N-acetyltransferase [Aerococcus viridans]MEB7389001.1 GNAT family N-acetyltransferase [Aerococcus viridans]
MIDIYFKDEYGELYEKLPTQEFIKFKYEDEIGVITNRFLKRKIPENILDSIEEYFDLITPYGYGGPVIERINIPEKKEELLKRYEKSFKKYAIENNIVSEFVRFHPIVRNAHDFQDIYEISFNRKTVGTNLNYDDPFTSEFSKSAKKLIRKILKDNNITFEIIEEPSSLKDFEKIYYSTMDRNEANDSYFFSENYFNDMIEKLSKNIVVVKVYFKNTLIAMNINFKYHNVLHTHLSGTLSEYIEFSPAYLLKFALVQFGKKNGFELIHYGGGKTSSEEDSLLSFKKKFGKNTTFDFHVGKKIWQEPLYHKLCKMTGNSYNSSYFPAYRADE